jgi:hypothetical protein
MTEELEHLRWIAVVTYRSESGPIEVDHHFEELEGAVPPDLARSPTGTRLSRRRFRLIGRAAEAAFDDD